MLNSCTRADIGTAAVVAVIKGTDHVIELVLCNTHPVGAMLEVRFSPSRVLMRRQIPSSDYETHGLSLAGTAMNSTVWRS